METVQPTNLWQATDSFLSGIQRQQDSMDMKPFYPTQTSPSGTGFPQLFTYAPPNLNPHLSANLDDNSLLIQNPSLT